MCYNLPDQQNAIAVMLYQDSRSSTILLLWFNCISQAEVPSHIPCKGIVHQQAIKGVYIRGHTLCPHADIQHQIISIGLDEKPLPWMKGSVQSQRTKHKPPQESMSSMSMAGMSMMQCNQQGCITAIVNLITEKHCLA